MNIKEQYKVKSYYIAYFDILGYKAFFENQENDIIEFLHNIVDMASDVIKKLILTASFLENNLKSKRFLIILSLCWKKQ